MAEAPRHATVFDDQTRQLSRVYGEALLNAAGPQAANVLDELETLIHDVFDRQPAIATTVGSPAVGRERREEVLRHTLQGRVSDTLFHFLLVLNRHQRLNILRQIAITARDILETRSGRIQIEVRSAVPLADDQQERLRQDLRTTLHREPVLHLHVDPDLIGGVLVRVGDRVYDATIRGRLDNLRTQLLERR
jgi:F-type H+-transporting ATPase subunit delta